ncbi:MAG TPA: ClpXP protease specificity-enhancing factor [Steroidobacteraceae bacterium]|nr:ClpXP protease specificity-enhancing factor [Steroidobacteraceae bacterium]
MSDTPLPAKRPYLLRAMHQWMTDGGQTPFVIVDVDRHAVEVPRASVKDGKIVLNISYDATERLNIGNDWLELDTRFGGVIHHVRAPIGAILGIYARETGEGMVFSEQDLGPQPPPQPQPPKPPAEEGRARPRLKVVK